MLLFKDLNSRGDIISNNTFMTIADVPYLASKHLNNPINPFTGNIITNDYKYTNYIDTLELYDGDPNTHSKTTFRYSIHRKIKDNIFEITNWIDVQ